MPSTTDIGSPGSVEGQGLFDQRGPHGACYMSQGGGHNRRLQHRMGCCVATQNSPGALGCKGWLRSHKCLGTEGCAFGPPTFSAVSEGETCSYTVRQHLDRLSHQSPRGHQVVAASEGVPRPLDVGGPSSVHPAGSVSAGGGQPDCRLSLSPKASTRRMVPPPRGSAEDLEPLRSGGGRSVCLRGVNSLPSMVLSHRRVRFPRPGCTGAPVASGSAVRLPPSSSNLADSSEGLPRGAQAVAGGPILAGTDLVSAAAQSLSRDTMASPGPERPAVSAGGTDMAPQSSTTPAVGLASGGPEPQLIGLSAPVCHTILNARAASTRLQYGNRWKLFSQWCAGRSENPVACPVSTILEFLQSLLDVGRSPSTLKVYVAAISCHHEKVDNATVGSHKMVSLFLRGACRLCSPMVPRAPVWDLPLVLEPLCRPPFEP